MASTAASDLSTHKKKNPTKLHPDVLVGVVLPQLLVLFAVAHHGEHNVREDGEEVRLQQLP